MGVSHVVVGGVVVIQVLKRVSVRIIGKLHRLFSMIGSGFDSKMCNHMIRRSRSRRLWGIMLVSRIMIFEVCVRSFIAEGLCL